MSLHPLVDFIYSEFGKPLGDLLLAGYGRPPGGRKESFEFHAPWRGKAARAWLVEVTARSLPGDIEPLVLAAILKFLLDRVDFDEDEYVTATFELNMHNVLRELARDGTTRVSAEEAHQIILKYTGLSYALRERITKPFRPPTKSRVRGNYTFLRGYTWITDRHADAPEPTHIVDRVTINEEFVGGLKRGEIIFAGMTLGERRPANMSAL